METIAVDLDRPIEWFLEEGRVNNSDENEDDHLYDGIGFIVSPRIDLSINSYYNIESKDIVTDQIPEDHVIRLKSDQTVCVGKSQGYYYLNPKGYKFVRPRLVAYIQKHKPTAIRGKKNVPITIEQIDAIFTLWWLSVLAATQKDLEKAESKVAAIKQGLASLEKIKLAEMLD